MEWLQRKKFSIRDFFSGTDNSESGNSFCFNRLSYIWSDLVFEWPKNAVLNGNYDDFDQNISSWLSDVDIFHEAAALWTCFVTEWPQLGDRDELNSNLTSGNTTHNGRRAFPRTSRTVARCGELSYQVGVNCPWKRQKPFLLILEFLHSDVKRPRIRI